jgi:hypothetical protein
MQRTPLLSLRLLALLLPQEQRDPVVGDLIEEHAAGTLRWPARALLGIAWHHHRGCYGERSDAAALLRLHAVALAGVLVLPLAGATVQAGAGVFNDLLAAGTLAFWGAAPALAGLAAGLWLGRAPLPAPQLDSARLHALPGLLAALAMAAHGPGALVAAMALLLGGFAAGRAGRRAAATGPGA